MEDAEKQVKWTWFAASLKNNQDIVFQSVIDPDLTKFEFTGKPIRFRKLLFLRNIMDQKGNKGMVLMRHAFAAEANKEGVFPRESLAFMIQPDQQIINDAREIFGEKVIATASPVDASVEAQIKANISKLKILENA